MLEMVCVTSYVALIQIESLGSDETDTMLHVTQFFV